MYKSFARFLARNAVKATVLGVVALAPVAANATPFDFSETFEGGVLLTGSFDGTLNGNLITNLSHISVLVNGVAFVGSGSLFASHYDGGWVSGGGVASLDGTQNNFLFVDVDLPNNFDYTNFFYSIPGFTDAFVNPGGVVIADPAPTNFTAHVHEQAQAAAVPEPAAWMLMLGGFGFVGASLRQRRNSAVSFG